MIKLVNSQLKKKETQIEVFNKTDELRNEKKRRMEKQTMRQKQKRSDQTIQCDRRSINTIIQIERIVYAHPYNINMGYIYICISRMCELLVIKINVVAVIFFIQTLLTHSH